MASYHIGGILIAMIGVMMMAMSAPAFRLAGRNTLVEPQFSYSMMTWLTRGLGFIFTVLGIVTYLH